MICDTCKHSVAEPSGMKTVCSKHNCIIHGIGKCDSYVLQTHTVGQLEEILRDRPSQEDFDALMFNFNMVSSKLRLVEKRNEVLISRLKR